MTTHRWSHALAALALSASGCLMNWGALEPVGAATGGAAGAVGASGASGASAGAAGAGGDPSGGGSGAGGDPAAGAGGDWAGGAGGDPAGGAGGDPAGGAGGDPAAGAGGAAGVECTEPGAALDPASGHCYFRLGGPPRSWMSARDACAGTTPPSHLATVTSQTEQDFVAALPLPQDCWLGLSGADGSLAWVTGEALEFTAWAPGQPNGSGFVCARIDSSDGLWRDESCGKQQSTLCERE